MKRLLVIALMLLMLATGAVFLRPEAKAERPEVRVFAAASLHAAMTELADEFVSQHGCRVRVNTASSSTLARQIEAGAPCDVYVSAHQKWMEFLEDRSLINSNSRCSPMGNSLVLVASAGSTGDINLNRFEGRLALGDPAHVPAGIYAKQALVHLNLYERLEGQIVPCRNVVAAQVLVERGEVAAGIVYGSNAMSNRLRIVRVFPPTSHAPICYAAASTRGTSVLGGDFLRFLQSPRAQQILLKYRFTTPGTISSAGLEGRR